MVLASEITININSILAVAGLITSLGVIVGLLWAIFQTKKKWDDYGIQIQTLRDEQYMQTRVLQATLDGLKQLGCNGKVTDAKNELDDYINKLSHGKIA